MTTRSTDLGSTLTGLQIHDAMHADVVSCRPGDDLASVAATLAGHGIHATFLEPLTSRNPLTVTDLELIRAVLQRADGTRVEEVAREPAATLPSDALLHEAVAKMAELYVAHLLVTDPASGTPCGVISSFDVASVLGGHQPTHVPARPASARPASSTRTLSEARAGDVMHPGVVTCPPDVPLWTVARSMAEHRLHCVAVVGVGDAGAHRRHFSWGLINAMEIVLASHRDALGEPAATIAAAAPPAVNESDSLQRAAELMVKDDARHVVVIGPSGLPSGMISTLDVMRILAA